MLMKKRLHTKFQFILNCFLIAVIMNTIVSSAHLLTGKTFSFSGTTQLLLFSLGVYAIFYAIVFFVVYLIANVSAGLEREKSFWLLMLTGVVSTVIVFLAFKHVFDKYTDNPGVLAAIGSFSIMVSLASQYQYFIHPQEEGQGQVVHE